MHVGVVCVNGCKQIIWSVAVMIIDRGVLYFCVRFFVCLIFMRYLFLIATSFLANKDENIAINVVSGG